MKTVTALLASMSLLACATPGKRTAVGAGAGAATGAVVGGALGGGKGAAVGAVTGAVAGGAAGNILDRQMAELKAKDARATRTANGILVRLKEDLLFEVNSDVLRPQAIDELSSLGDVLAKYPQDRIQVMGFTDSTGTAEYNDDLSRRRAEAVRRILISRGLQENQAVAIGMGEQSPVATNATREGRSKNRRVELHIALAK